MRAHDDRSAGRRRAVDLRVVDISFGDIVHIGDLDIAGDAERAARHRHRDHFHVFVRGRHHDETANVLHALDTRGRVPRLDADGFAAALGRDGGIVYEAARYVVEGVHHHAAGDAHRTGADRAAVGRDRIRRSAEYADVV